MEDYVDLAPIHIFLSKNLVLTLLDETYHSIHVKTKKKKGIIVSYVPLLHTWFIYHMSNKGPFLENKGNLKWSQRIMSLTAKDIRWYYRAYDDVKFILNYGNIPNVPLIGTKDGLNYNPRLALCQLGYPLLCKPNPEHVEEFILYERVDNIELLNNIVRAWREVRLQGRSELRKKNCIAKEAYTHWVKDRFEEIIFPFSFDPSTNIQHPMLTVFPTSKVKLKESIKRLDKEKVDILSNLGSLTREKEDLELNLNQKRVMTSQEVEGAQEGQFKRRKVGDTLKGTIDSLFAKKKQLVDA
ncbi:uncharacterized protein LOC127102222 [Lathyrus oleraceus]|uniref:uncharacterized protein LOC127102222 n=1 Tax=Pisum sativum TaxID=3888 RepID=UPI0021CF45D5|nr:uncharacterized protein LOC127102222 [Pisum sativum]